MRVTTPSPASELLTPRPPGRLIEVGIRSGAHDPHVVTWAVRQADPGRDLVRFVNAYAAPERQGARHVADGRHQAALDLAEAAVRLARAQRPGLQARAVAVPDAPVDALAQLSELADLVVVGDDSATTTDPLCWRVQDRAACPVVAVPPVDLPDPALPVTVVVDDNGVGDSVIDWAAEWAARCGSGLQVSRVGASLQRYGPLTADFLADLQSGLDEWLAAWRRPHPHPGVVGRIEVADHWLAAARAGSSLLVTSVAGAATVRHRTPGAACPSAVVPVDR